jgi:hypothetical protein
LELKTLQGRKQTIRDRENLDRAISFDQKSASTYSLKLSRHMSTKWLTVASPHIPDAVIPAPHLGFVQVRGSQSVSDWLKGLGNGLGHIIWWAIFWAMRLCKNLEEETGTL